MEVSLSTGPGHAPRPASATLNGNDTVSSCVVACTLLPKWRGRGSISSGRGQENEFRSRSSLSESRHTSIALRLGILNRPFLVKATSEPTTAGVKHETHDIQSHPPVKPNALTRLGFNVIFHLSLPQGLIIAPMKGRMLQALP